MLRVCSLYFTAPYFHFGESVQRGKATNLSDGATVVVIGHDLGMRIFRIDQLGLTADCTQLETGTTKTEERHHL